MRLQCKFIQTFFMVAFILTLQLFINQRAIADTISPVGIWQTIDDNTNKPRSIVQIWQQGGELRGKIIKVYYQPGESAKDVCEKCIGVNHNRLILGMTIMWGLTQEGGHWDGGKILDPKNGKVYHCKLTLSPDNQQLNVRGYIGVPLLGRTQTWIRQPTDLEQ